MLPGMPATRRHAAFLRGVMPTNCRMAELRAAFEAAGFGNVKTLLGSGNVLFDAGTASEATLERRAEAAMEKHLGRTFMTVVRPVDALRELLAWDPWARFRLAPGSKRNVTFLRESPGRLKLPIELDGARILAVRDREVLSAHVPGPHGPVFMKLIEQTFGKEQTTRTWETVTKAAR
jgi:uncharacterized protein (DUF1697 family)